jgi:hypothetical protein
MLQFAGSSKCSGAVANLALRHSIPVADEIYRPAIEDLVAYAAAFS